MGMGVKLLLLSRPMRLLVRQPLWVGMVGCVVSWTVGVWW